MLRISKLLAIISSVVLCTMTSLAQAQSFEQTESCQSLVTKIKGANSSLSRLDSLLSSKEITNQSYMSELYEGTKVLSEAGELFFRATDAHESACRNILKEAKAERELFKIYEQYVVPVSSAMDFFTRAKATAVSLGKQRDVDTLTQLIKEYQASVMKLVSLCQSDLATSPELCQALANRLTDALTR